MIIMLTKMPSFRFQIRCVCMCKVKPGGGGQIPKCEALHFGTPPPPPPSFTHCQAHGQGYHEPRHRPCRCERHVIPTP